MLTPEAMLALAAELTDAQANDDAQSLAAIAWQLYGHVGEHLAEIGRPFAGVPAGEGLPVDQAAGEGQGPELRHAEESSGAGEPRAVAGIGGTSTGVRPGALAAAEGLAPLEGEPHAKADHHQPGQPFHPAPDARAVHHRVEPVAEQRDGSKPDDAFGDEDAAQD